MFLVIYYQRYVGFHFDEYTQGFYDEWEAEAYAKKLNEELAKEWECNIEDMGDYYTIQEIPVK